jgi:hypothetical protein
MSTDYMTCAMDTANMVTITTSRYSALLKAEAQLRLLQTIVEEMTNAN